MKCFTLSMSLSLSTGRGKMRHEVKRRIFREKVDVSFKVVDERNIKKDINLEESIAGRGRGIQVDTKCFQFHQLDRLQK